MKYINFFMVICLITITSCINTKKVFIPKPVFGLRTTDLKWFPESCIIERGEQTIQLSEFVKIKARVGVTTKGNGTLELHSNNGGEVFSIMIYDSHDDGNLFKNGMLFYCFADIDNDNVLELIISGIGQILDDEENENKITKEIMLSYIYKFNLKTKCWEKLSGSGISLSPCPTAIWDYI